MSVTFTWAILLLVGIGSISVYCVEQNAEARAVGPRACKSTCSLSPWRRAEAVSDEEVQKVYKENEGEITALVKKGSSTGSSKRISPVSIFYSKRCPWKSCPSKSRRLRYCEGCRIIYPRHGISSVECSRPNSRCSFWGRCNTYGPRRQFVVLYCPRQIPRLRWKIVTTCTNCCCNRRFRG